MFLFNFNIDNYYIIIIIIIKSVFIQTATEFISKYKIEVRLVDMNGENCF